jgi:hypothetical protein
MPSWKGKTASSLLRTPNSDADSCALDFETLKLYLFSALKQRDPEPILHKILWQQQYNP